MPIGGRIEVELPSLTSLQAGWQVGASASVVFSEPAEDTPVVTEAVWLEAGGRRVGFKIAGNAIQQRTDVTFTISHVTTPTRQVGAASETSIWTYDSLGNIIDSASDVSTDAITVGDLTGVLRFDMHTDLVHFTGLAKVSFTTAGQIPVGGHIRVVLPHIFGAHRGWSVVHPNITFVLPSEGPPLAGLLSEHGGRNFTFEVASSAIAQQTAVVFVLTNVTTPTRRVGQLNGTTLMVMDSKDNLIGVSYEMRTDDTFAGSLVNVDGFDAAVDTPSFRHSARVSFMVGGHVPVDGHIRVVLPKVLGVQDGWRIDALPAIVFSRPSVRVPVVNGSATEVA
ncbi:MAG: hypothetical protein VXW74_05320, partial [Candidatus Thermoplasmatota archaeon]|nr:hypothetical protein [Candidatus Thermoplasmatota archaeon]